MPLLNATPHSIFYQPSVGGLPRSLQSRFDEEINVKDLGAIGDGSTHPLSGLYASITSAAVDYPFLATVYYVAVTAGGTGYASPTVSPSGGGGTGFAATVVEISGVVVQINVTNPGTGYTSAPTLTISGASGSGATATAYVGLVTDEIDWAALQTAICRAAGVTSPSMPAVSTGAIFLPRPSTAYRINQTLRYEGAAGQGLTIRGAVGGTRGPSGSRIRWYGDSGGTLFYTAGSNSLYVSDCEFDGASLAKYVVHLDALNTQSSSAGSSGLVFHRCTIGWAAGSGSSCVVAGHVLASGEGTHQVDNVIFDTCNIFGNGIDTDYGFSQLCPGNVRNFKFYQTGVLYNQIYGVHVASGNCAFVGGEMGLNGTGASGGDFLIEGASIVIDTLSSEGSPRFLVGTTGANYATVLIRGIQFNNSGAVAGHPADDVVVNYTGNLNMQGCYFLNGRTGATVPKIVVGDTQVTPTPGNFSGSFISIGNHYVNATGYVPAYDGSGNPIFDPTAYYYTRGISALSIGDIGGIAGTLERLQQSLPMGGDLHVENFYMTPLFNHGLATAINVTPNASGPITLTVLESTSLQDSTAGTFVLDLPAASATKQGQIFLILNVGTANQVTITRAGSDTLIDGSTSGTTYALLNATRVALQSDGGSKYYVIGK